MKLRSAFLSAPAVAGFALLALVVGTIFGVRSAMNDPADTEVAGNVIERSEAPEATEDPTSAPIDPVIVRPRPRPARTEAPAPVDTTPVAPAEEPEQPVGLIPDEDGPSAPVDEEPANEPDNEPAPRPEPDPEPTRRPRPRPEPRPEPTPEPEPTEEPTENPRDFALHEGAGFSRDTALANETGNSGKFNWDILSVVGHGQSEDAQASREPADRIVVGFFDEASDSQEPVRDFRCDATVTAGSRRLTTDRNHYFEISMWPTDGYDVGDEPIHTAFVSVALDLAPGEQAVLEGGELTLDAAEGVDYTCSAEYRS